MSHKGGRKSHTTTLAEEKDKRSTDSPVKEMKKKIAANAEKEKQVSDKADKAVSLPERSDNTEKVPEKPQSEKTDGKKAHAAEKVDKTPSLPEKNAQKADKVAEKTVKTTEKEKVAEKEKTVEKSDKKIDKVADKKVDKPEKKNEAEKKDEGKGEGKDKPEKAKQNGAVGDANGDADTVSDDSSEAELLVIDDQDEVFPELTYDDTSDADYEEGTHSRSFTRRSQVKVTKTPETPRPASVKEDDSKEKVLKMNDSLATDRKLRSADSPKQEAKKPTDQKKPDSPKKDKVVDLTDETSKEGNEKSEGAKTNAGGKNKLEMEVVIDLESIDETRCRTRARVSPYTSRLPTTRHDQTTSSVMANYTGNNTTMEMDISETSSILEDPNLDDSSYLRGLRAIKGRSSYKPLKELALKHTLNRSTRSTTSSTNISLIETARPTGTVVGRKRKPDGDVDDVELASEAVDAEPEEAESDSRHPQLFAQTKRIRLFDRFSVPFRGFNTHRAPEIVGINTDLPLTAPVASTSAFDPETLKPSPSDALPAATHDRDGKRCAIV